MSKRDDIIEPDNWSDDTSYGLVYSEILGWIDLGHAQGSDIQKLLNRIRFGESGFSPYYVIEYRQLMHAHGRMIGTGKFVRWRIKKGRSSAEIHSIALAMMMSVASSFENYQKNYFSWVTDSGFSCEDLTSDLFGFYRVILKSNYKDRLKLVSKRQALVRWDYYGPVGQWKNRGFLPLLFPDPEDDCVKHLPYKGRLPDFMRWIEPYTDFTSGNVTILVDDGTAFSFYPERL